VATGETAAERDARAIADRAAEDEREAGELRTRIRAGFRPRADRDAGIRDHLSPDEDVVEIRDAVVAERVESDGTSRLLGGRLYVTTARLLLLGPEPLGIPLAEVDEVAVAGERLLVTLVDGSGLRLDAGRPRLLRVQIAAAQAAVDTTSQRASR
jgi:hypothetical protein